MKAAVMHAPNKMIVEDVETPTPDPDQVLMAVKAVAICASDLHIFEEGHSSGTYPSGPLILGHEFSGEVAEVGSEVTAFAPGDRVACEPSWHCGECEMCQRGLTNLCRNVIFPSFPDRDGAMAQYITVPDFSLAKLPENVSFIEGALVEPLGVGLHAVRLADLVEGQDIAILGAGTIGIATLDIALAFGAGQAYVAEPREGRQAYPASLGAVVRDSAEDLEKLFEKQDSFPPVVFEASGGATAFAESLQITEAGGKAVIIGIPEPDEQVFSARVPRRKELTVQFCRRSRNTLEDCLQMVADGTVHASEYPVQTFSLDEASEAFAAAAAREGDMIRAVVEP
ncbi:MAG: alcohol dehydrogenase catalytic domain-containing protein [Armatimonadota bacterium]